MSVKKFLKRSINKNLNKKPINKNSEKAAKPEKSLILSPHYNNKKLLLW